MSIVLNPHHQYVSPEHAEVWSSVEAGVAHGDQNADPRPIGTGNPNSGRSFFATNHLIATAGGMTSQLGSRSRW